MISDCIKTTNKFSAVKTMSFRGSHIPTFCFNRNNKKHLHVVARLFEKTAAWNRCQWILLKTAWWFLIVILILFLIHLWLSNEIKHLHSGDQPLFLIYKGHNFEIKNLKVWQLDNLLEVGICSSEVIFIHLYKQK